MSFLPPNTLPRLTDSPYDNPSVFADTWDETMTEIENASGVSGDASALLAAFLKNGRIYGIPPELPSTPALGITLPEGFQWVQDGQLITLEEDTFVGDVPQNFSGYAVMTATYDSGSDSWEFELTTSSTKPESGSGVVAYVESNTTTVTSIDTTESESDVILTMPEIVSRLQGGTGGESGSGSSGTTITTLSQLTINSSDTRNAADVLLDIENRVEDIELNLATGGTRPAITDIDQVHTELSIARQGVIALAPDEGERSRSANVEAAVDGTFGDGTNSHPDFLDYTNATLNDDGEFEV